MLILKRSLNSKMTKGFVDVGERKRAKTVFGIGLIKTYACGGCTFLISPISFCYYD